MRVYLQRAVRAILVAVLVLAICTTAIAQDVTNTWNANCASRNFTPGPYLSGTTFGDIYGGTDYAADIEAMELIIDHLCGPGSGLGGGGGENLEVNATLQNW